MAFSSNAMRKFKNVSNLTGIRGVWKKYSYRFASQLFATPVKQGSIEILLLLAGNWDFLFTVNHDSTREATFCLQQFRDMDYTISTHASAKEATAERLIDTLENGNQWKVLYKHYMERKSFRDIAEEMGYVYRHITRIHGQALAELRRRCPGMS
jgi:hypothetical protein